LLARNKVLEDDLAASVAWVFYGQTAEGTQHISCSLHEVALKQRGSGKMQPGFDPKLSVQPAYWPGDISMPGRMSFWVSATRAHGSILKAYVSYFTAPERRAPASVRLSSIGEGMPNQTVLEYKLTPDRPWDFIGTFTVTGNRVPIFKAATQEERDAEWQALTGGPPKPAVQATPAPTGARERAPFDREAADRLREQSRRSSEIRNRATGTAPK
jgi:hypothetical protein